MRHDNTSPLVTDERQLTNTEVSEPELSPLRLRRAVSACGVSDPFETRLLVHVLQAGRLSVSQLPEFVQDAREKAPSLTDYVLSMAVADENDLVAVAADLHDMPSVDLTSEHIEPELVELLSAPQAQAWNVLPYARDDFGNLLIAIADPNDLDIRVQVERALAHERKIMWRLAAPSALRVAIDRCYTQDTVLTPVRGDDEEIEEASLTTVRGEQDSGIIRLVNTLIIRAHGERASDIHIEQREHETLVRYRVDGVLRDVSRIPRKDTPKVISRIKTMTRTMRADIRHKPQDGRITVKLDTGPLDLRVVSIPTTTGEKIVMRLLDPRQVNLSLEELGMTGANLDRYMDAITLPHGCVFITGPTGSGKSTTLYSSLRRIHSTEETTYTIEDPVEYKVDYATQIDVSGQGTMALTFAEALKAILRGDPNNIMVGEIRDTETARIAIEAALTGHRLFSTLHTNDAIEAIGRLDRLGVEPFLIATAVECVVAQRLVRRLCPTCKVEVLADADMLRGMRAPAWAIRRAAEEPFRLFRARRDGCNACRGMGYHGRTGVHEVVRFNDDITTGIIQGKSLPELKQIARDHGMSALRDDAFVKVAAGITSLEEMASVIA